MTYRRNYPKHGSEVRNPDRKYKPDVLRAVKAFARSKPWRGTVEERKVKFLALHDSLCDVYGIAPSLAFCQIDQQAGNGFYQPLTNAIGLVGKLSVVTFLHEFAHARGMDERQACGWSINLFARCFPRSWAGCRFNGHLVIRERN
jgi:hypothetical protein